MGHVSESLVRGRPQRCGELYLKEFCDDVVRVAYQREEGVTIKQIGDCPTNGATDHYCCGSSFWCRESLKRFWLVRLRSCLVLWRSRW